MSNLNWVDNVILVIILLSIFAGLMRGLVRELIALITWVAAFIVGIMFSPKLAAAFSGAHGATSSASGVAEPSALAIGCSFVALFLGTMIIGTIINYFVSKIVEGPGISFSNRLLGGVFGLARGFVLILVAIFLVQMSPLQEEVWWTSSTFVHSFQPTVKYLNSFVQPRLEDLKEKVGDTMKNVNPEKFLPSSKDKEQTQPTQPQPQH